MYDDDDGMACVCSHVQSVMVVLPAGMAVRVPSADRPSSRVVVWYHRFVVSVALCTLLLLFAARTAAVESDRCPPKVKITSNVYGADRTAYRGVCLRTNVLTRP